MAVITSSGPLTRIEITDLLNNAVNHVSDQLGEWYGDIASGTFIAVSGTLYGPADLPAGNTGPRTPFSPVAQSGPSGTGTAADPWTIVTVVGTGSGVTLIQTDRYVVGREYFDSSLTVQNNSGTRQAGFLPGRRLSPRELRLQLRAGDRYRACGQYGRRPGRPPRNAAATHRRQHVRDSSPS